MHARTETLEQKYLAPGKIIVFIELLIGYGLIMASVWTIGPIQRVWFRIAAVWFLLSAVLAMFRKDLPSPKLPSLRLITGIFGLTLFVVVLTVAPAAALGTLHGLFGTKDPLMHASMYVLWAFVQQYIQQAFFFARLEQITRNGLLAGFSAAALFGLAHIPNPILAPVTFLGGWILSEIYRRWRSIIPLGIAHGLIGIAIAISVPDALHHHMRVGMGYLYYPY